MVGYERVRKLLFKMADQPLPVAVLLFVAELGNPAALKRMSAR